MQEEVFAALGLNTVSKTSIELDDTTEEDSATPIRSRCDSDSQHADSPLSALDVHECIQKVELENQEETADDSCRKLF